MKDQNCMHKHILQIKLICVNLKQLLAMQINICCLGISFTSIWSFLNKELMVIIVSNCKH